ncbi:MAG: alpha/beta fold hydrolase [Parvularculaceae bacterium]
MSVSSVDSSPHQTPERFTVPLDDGVQAGWRWRSPGAPPLLFCHATGFCASTYQRLLAPLAGRFDVYALDLRGHGRTQLPADPKRLRSWSVYARDIAAFLDSRDRESWVLAGHSMGAAASLMAATGRRDVAALALIEPVALPLPLIWIVHSPLWAICKHRFPIVRGALRRRDRWPDRDEACAIYARKPPFARWANGVLEDYLLDGLITEEGGDVRLACAPSWEAATFAAQANDLWRAAAVAPAPMAVLAARHRSSTLMGRARQRFRRLGADLIDLEGVTHLAPMEDPETVAAGLAEAVGRTVRVREES